MTKVERRVASRKRESGRLAPEMAASTNQSESLRSSPSDGLSDSAGPSFDQSAADDSLSTMQLTPDIDDHALAYFLSNFMMSGNLEPTSPVEYHSSREYRLMRKGLEMSMKSVALASMASFTKSPKLSVEARRRYLTAVANTNEALKSPVIAKDDMLLSTVLILNSFEVIGGPDEQSLVDWANHAYGAAALVKLRGPKQFETPNGLVLFTSTISLVLAASMREDRPLPENILELTEDAAKHATSDQAFWKFFLVKVRFVYFYTQHIKVWPFLNDTIHPDVALSKALELDWEMASVFENMDSFHDSYDVYLPHMAEYSQDGHCHVFKNFISVSMFNDMRIHRIVVHALIRNILEQGLVEESSFYDRFGQRHFLDTGRTRSPSLLTDEGRQIQLQRSQEIQCQMQSGILATVPQQLGFINYEDGIQSKSPDQDPLFNFPWSAFESWYHEPVGPTQNADNVPVVRAYGGYALSWGLFVAGKVKNTSPDLKAKIVRLLHMLGSRVGNRQAELLAERTEVEMGNF